jgi:hypothetical protein
MKKLHTHLLLVFISLVFFSCEKEEDDTQTSNDPLLHVEFTNSAESEFVIKNIQMVSHGNAGETDEGPIGNWSGNIIPGNQQIAPGEMVEMDLEIENLFKYMYRIQVVDENGNDVWLHKQDGYGGTGGGSITHWGSHKRQVYCTVVRNTSTGFIYIQGWGDNAY